MTSHKSVIENYAILQEEFALDAESYLEPDIKLRIIGVKHQISTFEFLIGIVMGEVILKARQ